MWWFFAAARAAEAEWLRPAFVQYLCARGPDDADYAAAELVFGELVGNVVRHAPGEIAVRIDWRAGELPLLSVCDRGPGFSYKPSLPKDVFAETGRGLFLVGIFADDLRVCPNPGGGSCVSVRLRIGRAGAPHAGSGQLSEQNSSTKIALVDGCIDAMRRPYAASSRLSSSASSSTRSNS